MLSRKSYRSSGFDKAFTTISVTGAGFGRVSVTPYCRGSESRRLFAAVAGIVLASCLSASCRMAPAYFSGSTMGTTYSVVIVDPVDKVSLNQTKEDVAEVLDAVNAEMSTYLPDSALSRFNRQHSTAWQTISPGLAEVLAQANRISRLSGGAFDVTVGPLVNLWGFGPVPVPERPPSDEVVRDTMKQTGYRHLEVQLQPPRARKRIPELYVDLSAIAKGYAVDQLARLLYRAQMRNFLVEIGGELRAAGLNRENKPWRVGIEKPGQFFSAERVVHLKDVAIATSGDYRNYVELDGRKFSHGIDPVTGKPVAHDTISVSVVADNAMEADALATALLVLGQEAGMALAENHAVAAYFIYRSGDDTAGVWSTAFKPYL